MFGSNCESPERLYIFVLSFNITLLPTLLKQTTFLNHKHNNTLSGKMYKGILFIVYIYRNRIFGNDNMYSKLKIVSYIFLGFIIPLTTYYSFVILDELHTTLLFPLPLKAKLVRTRVFHINGTHRWRVYQICTP